MAALITKCKYRKIPRQSPSLIELLMRGFGWAYKRVGVGGAYIWGSYKRNEKIFRNGEVKRI